MPAAPLPVFRVKVTQFFLYFAVWTLIGLSFGSQFYLSSLKAGRPIAWTEALKYALGDWYVFAILAVPVIFLARRFPLARKGWAGPAFLHLAASLAFSFVYMVLRALLGQAQSWAAGISVPFSEAFNPLLIKTFHFNMLIYWVILSVAHAFSYYQKYHERELHASELETRLAQAKLQALQMQLNPHFLFNTLHAISALMHQDVEAADRMISRLSELLRYALENTDEHEVPLDQELKFLAQYLEIEQTRFGSRLLVKMNVAPDTLPAQVPNLVLQPLIENAIRHGIEPHARQGVIEISARRAGASLELRVSDNGNGLSGSELSEGVGISNTRARLQHLYGEKQELVFKPGERGGLAALVRLPFHTRRLEAASLDLTGALEKDTKIETSADKEL